MKRLYIIIIALGALIVSCQKSDIEVADDPRNVPEGQPAYVQINIEDAVHTRGGLSLQQEQKINNIFVMVFDKTGVKVSQSYFNSNIPTSLSNVQTVSGTNMSIYVVANLSSQNIQSATFSKYFDNIYTVAELNEAKVFDLANDLNANRDLLMSGFVTGKTINPTTSPATPITITLNFAASRVTLYLVKSLTTPTDSYDMTNWTVNNYPAKAYMFQQASDAVVPGTSTDYTNSATSIAWVDTTVMINSVATPAKYAFLYVYENRRGTNNNTLETQKALNVPANATSMVLQGYYKTAAQNKVTGVTTTVYLGGNNFNDYNVYRGRDYAYVVTVRGVNDINIDSRVTSNSSGYQVNIFNTTLDCHPDRRPVQLITWPDIYTVQILDETDTPATAGFWLKASSIDLNKAVLRSGSYQRPLYNPTTDMVYSMSLNYTGNSTSTATSNMIYIYADENMTQTSRSGSVQVTSSAGEVVKIPVSQLGYQTMGNVGFRAYNVNGTINNADDYILAIENNEEITMNLTPGAAAGTESVKNMQWGFNNIVSEPTSGVSDNYQHRNGLVNTLRGVYGNTTGASSSTLLPPYGRSNTASISANSVTTTEQLHNPIFNSYPTRYCFEKNRDLDGDGKITNSNTLGVNEINWYLPSTDELLIAGVGQTTYSNSLNSLVNYTSSSEFVGSSTNIQYYVPLTGVTMGLSKFIYLNARCVRKVYQAQPQAVKNSPYVEAGTRIINTTGFKASALRSVNVSCPTPLHDFGSTIGQQLPKRFVVGAKDSQLNGATGGVYSTWAEACGFTLASNSSSTSFVIASPATGCQAYSESGAPAGTWRLPTLKELQIMFLLRDELSAQPGNGFSAFSFNAWYQSSTYGNETNSMICFHGTMRGSAFAAKTSPTPIRCIRDL